MLGAQTRTHVILFLCRAEFSGRSDVPYAQAPITGSSHDCILFVAQPGDSPDYETARAILAKHGWINAHFKRAGPFQPESVNADQWRVFQSYYEECLEHGDSVVWYV